MGFFKRDGEQLLQAPTFVYGDGYDLTIENHAEQTYPVNGWYWFDTLDEAMQALLLPPEVPTVTALQGMLAIASLGSEAVAGFNAWMAALDPVADFATIAYFQKAQTWRRDHPAVAAGASALGLTETQLDALFALADTL